MSDGEVQVTTWDELPPGVYEGANRYSTDDEEVLTLWRAGQTWDVRVHREVERIRTDALNRVVAAFYTDGPLDPRGRTTEELSLSIRAIFNDVMLAGEPGRAEIAARQALNENEERTL